MATGPPVSGKAVLTLCLGLLSVACGVFAVFAESDLLVLVMLVLWLAACVLGVATRRATDEARGGWLAGCGVGVATGGIVLGMCLMPPVRFVRDKATQIAAMNNLRSVVQAMTAYAEAHGGTLPPAVLRDGTGRPLHSWRVLVLPYLGEESLYREFRLDEPWDSPHNLALLPRMPKVYAPPPALPATVRAGQSGTFFQVFTGPHTAFEGAEGLRLPEDFPDGLANTILVVEAGEPVPWTKPDDLVYDPQGPLPSLGGIFTGEGRLSLVGGNRVKQVHVGLADGSVRELTGLSEATLRTAITRDDGKPVDPDWWLPP